MNEKEKLILQLIKNVISGTKFENKVYQVGGSVRDEILGIPYNDIDLIVVLPRGGIEFALWFSEVTDCFVHDVVPEHATAKVTINGITIDISASLRFKPYSEDVTEDIVMENLKHHLALHDYTVNTVVKNISTNEVLDFFDCMKDIKSKTLRTLESPDTAFKTDAFRIIRGIRFAYTNDWKLPFSLIKSMKDNAAEILNIKNGGPEKWKLRKRFKEEFTKIEPNKIHKVNRLLHIIGLDSYIYIKKDTRELYFVEKNSNWRRHYESSEHRTWRKDKRNQERRY